MHPVDESETRGPELPPTASAEAGATIRFSFGSRFSDVLTAIKARGFRRRVIALPRRWLHQHQISRSYSVEHYCSIA